MLTYRFNTSGQIDIEALNEADAREKLKDCITVNDKRTGAFVLVVPTTLMMVLKDGREVEI